MNSRIIGRGRAAVLLMLALVLLAFTAVSAVRAQDTAPAAATVPGELVIYRWTTPVQHFMRTAAQDCEVGGVAIKAGDWLMLNYVAANHDPAQFPDPRRFDASREANRHAAFGAGAHQCLGLHLARLEMRLLFEALLDRIDTVELAGEPKRAKSTFVGGLKTLPLRVTAS